MSLVPTTLVIYVSSAAGPGVQPGSAVYAYGISYDSARWGHKNEGTNLASCYDVTTHLVALDYAIRSAVMNAPDHYNLVFEMDDKRFVDDLTENTYDRAMQRTAGGERAPDVCPIREETLQIIEMRTRQGDCSVKFIYSGENPTAQRGLEAARTLARSALTEPVA